MRSIFASRFDQEYFNLFLILPLKNSLSEFKSPNSATKKDINQDNSVLGHNRCGLQPKNGFQQNEKSM
jgi:hypothetical protein